MPNILSFSIPAHKLAGLVTGQLHPASVPNGQWDELIELALDQGLAGMLLWSLRQAGWTLASEPRLQALIDAARRNGRHNLLIEKARRQAAAAFDQVKIPAIWLKGVTLSQTHYPEPHLRPMSDLDVLVPPDRMAAARDALLALGFRPAKIDFFEEGGFTDQARHHECLHDRSGCVKLELHFRLLVPSLHYRVEQADQAWFWGQTEDLASNGPPFIALKPEANLLYLCAHAILQNQGEYTDLLHLLDLHLLVTRSAMNWDMIVNQAVAFRWTFAVEIALEILTDLFGTQLPEWVMEKLHQCRLPDEKPLFTLDPGRSTRRWDEWRQAFRSMSASQRAHLIWLTVFPPKAFLRRMYHLPLDQSLLRYYLHHFLDGGREVALALRQSRSNLKRPTDHGENIS